MITGYNSQLKASALPQSSRTVVRITASKESNLHTFESAKSSSNHACTARILIRCKRCIVPRTRPSSSFSGAPPVGVGRRPAASSSAWARQPEAAERAEAAGGEPLHAHDALPVEHRARSRYHRRCRPRSPSSPAGERRRCTARSLERWLVPQAGSPMATAVRPNTARTQLWQ